MHKLIRGFRFINAGLEISPPASSWTDWSTSFLVDSVKVRGRATHWLRAIARVITRREREWYEPDKYAAEMPFLKTDWPRG